MANVPVREKSAAVTAGEECGTRDIFRSLQRATAPPAAPSVMGRVQTLQIEGLRDILLTQGGSMKADAEAGIDRGETPSRFSLQRPSRDFLRANAPDEIIQRRS
jgi:hypothetical protein